MPVPITQTGPPLSTTDPANASAPRAYTHAYAREVDPTDLSASVRLLSTRRLLPFCLQMMPDYKLPPHIQHVAAALEAVERGEIRRLILSMPPRHGKSQLASIFFPAWYLGRNPDKRVILAAHTGTLAEIFSRQARNLVMDSRWPFAGVKLAEDSKSVTLWNLNKRRGGLLAMGIGGAITGSGGNLLLIDDPIKDMEEAMSEITLRKHEEWYKSTLYTRQEKDAAIVVTMTRWSEADIAGNRLAEMGMEGEDWVEIRLPALAESGDVLHRQPGEALWPEKYSAEDLDSIKRTVGSRVWGALYQQRPVPDEGALFKRKHFRYFEAHEDAYVLKDPLGDRPVAISGLFKFMTADLAISERKSADYSVFMTCGITSTGDLLVLDVQRDRMDGASLERLVESLYNRHQYDGAYIESVAFQSYLLQNLKRRLPLLPLHEVRPDKDKVTRAWAAAERVDAGQVYFRKDAPWLGDFEHELLTFPAGRHDDQVDAFAYAGIVHSKRAFATSAPYAKRRSYTGWTN